MKQFIKARKKERNCQACLQTQFQYESVSRFLIQAEGLMMQREGSEMPEKKGNGLRFIQTKMSGK